MANYKNINLTKSKLYSYAQKSSDFVNGQVDPSTLLGEMLANLLIPTGNSVKGTRNDAFKAATEYCDKYGINTATFYVVYRDPNDEVNYITELFERNI